MKCRSAMRLQMPGLSLAVKHARAATLTETGPESAVWPVTSPYEAGSPGGRRRLCTHSQRAGGGTGRGDTRHGAAQNDSCSKVAVKSQIQASFQSLRPWLRSKSQVQRWNNETHEHAGVSVPAESRCLGGWLLPWLGVLFYYDTRYLSPEAVFGCPNGGKCHLIRCVRRHPQGCADGGGGGAQEGVGQKLLPQEAGHCGLALQGKGVGACHQEI